MSGECERCGDFILDCLCDEYECPEPIRSYDVKATKEWISVKHSYPQEGEQVLCIDKEGRRFVATYSSMEAKWGIQHIWDHGYCCGREPGDTTHWLSLSQPPKVKDGMD